MTDIFKERHDLYIFKWFHKMVPINFLSIYIREHFNSPFSDISAFAKLPGMCRTLHFTLYRKCFKITWFSNVFFCRGRSYGWAHSLDICPLNQIHSSFPSTYWESSTQQLLATPSKVLGSSQPLLIQELNPPSSPHPTSHFLESSSESEILCVNFIYKHEDSTSQLSIQKT